MKYEAYINKIEGDAKFLSEDNNVIGLTRHVIEELRKVGVKPKAFVNSLSEFVEEKTPYSTSYTSGEHRMIEPCNLGTIFELWILKGNDEIHTFVTIINYGDTAQVTFSKPEFFDTAMLTTMKNMLSINCVKINMPYPYKFAVFEAFNAFKKLSNVSFEGIVRERMISMDDKKRGLIWRIESPNFEYSANLKIQ
ncbi:hypothetical protein [Stygiolobus caldivivus]|uniref:Uncharacterized protein n=1 Tax=Stygiolobus caldivivus TaxID=2824673 RepID=A0A8D5ZG98_9CREN|nr:hypothetical protein [Stygiolobus caldivivus]BCU70768.1 hypothetical protein KN1_20650 [Stygiolobus caldivivus]